MTNLPPVLRGELEVLTSRVAATSPSADGTIKLLVEYRDGQQVETVLIPTERFATACLSTQAGCAMGCEFCASAIGGLGRGLTSSEILQQMLHLWQAAGRRPSHVVFMGMGEPLANYGATVAALRAIVDPKRWGLSARRSRSPPWAFRPRSAGLQTRGSRLRLRFRCTPPRRPAPADHPAARNTTIEAILRAAEEFQKSRNREVTLEYVLLAGVNDSGVCADGLAGWRSASVAA